MRARLAMAIPNRKHWTLEEYLEFERTSDGRHEYLDGEVFAMVGASLKHNSITFRAAHGLYEEINEGCNVYQSDLRVKVSETGLYTYPDIVVICGEPQLSDDVQDTLLNPTLIIEVLSPSTEAYDRGKKFKHYMTVESLQEYVLISQEAPRIERYLRQTGYQWLYTAVDGLDSVLQLPSIGCTLALTDVYRQVSFDEPAPHHDNSITRDA